MKSSAISNENIDLRNSQVISQKAADKLEIIC